MCAIHVKKEKRTHCNFGCKIIGQVKQSKANQNRSKAKENKKANKSKSKAEQTQTKGKQKKSKAKQSIKRSYCNSSYKITGRVKHLFHNVENLARESSN